MATIPNRLLISAGGAGPFDAAMSYKIQNVPVADTSLAWTVTRANLQSMLFPGPYDRATGANNFAFWSEEILAALKPALTPHLEDSSRAGAWPRALAVASFMPSVYKALLILRSVNPFPDLTPPVGSGPDCRLAGFLCGMLTKVDSFGAVAVLVAFQDPDGAGRIDGHLPSIDFDNICLPLSTFDLPFSEVPQDDPRVLHMACEASRSTESLLTNQEYMLVYGSWTDGFNDLLAHVRQPVRCTACTNVLCTYFTNCRKVRAQIGPILTRCVNREDGSLYAPTWPFVLDLVRLTAGLFKVASLTRYLGVDPSPCIKKLMGELHSLLIKLESLHARASYIVGINKELYKMGGPVPILPDIVRED